MLISKSHYCPHAEKEHSNLAYAIYDNGDWCYACNLGTIEAKDYFAYKRQTPVKKLSGDINFPWKIESDPKKFNLDILAWLYNYYVYDEDIIKHKIMYAPYEKFKTASGLMWHGCSLLFPIVVDDEIVAYQRRFFPNKQLLSVKTQNHIKLFNGPPRERDDTIILTEDFISALRIGNNDYQSICLWGTMGNELLLNFILNEYTNINIWLDGDEPGKKASKKLFQKFQGMIAMRQSLFAFNPSFNRNYNINIISSELDPKCYSDDEIKEFLECLN